MRVRLQDPNPEVVCLNHSPVPGWVLRTTHPVLDSSPQDFSGRDGKQWKGSRHKTFPSTRCAGDKQDLSLGLPV